MMHKLLGTAVLLLLYAPATAQLRVEVELKSATLLSNDHVGNAWATTVYAGLPGGALSPLRKQRPTTFETSGDLLIKAQAVVDETYPDYGEASQAVRLADLQAGASKRITLDVVVREDRGRYRGNVARWRFVVEVVRK